MDLRSRFVTLYNLGNTYVTLGDVDNLMRNQRRCEAVQTWTEALQLDCGGTDRAKVAMAAGEALFEDGFLHRAQEMYKLVIKYDVHNGTLTAAAHTRLGTTSSRIALANKFTHGRPGLTSAAHCS
mmetsp:Transcript_23457/g.72148  ORF Transcript_23457/g.72148 Transcript_23457/m.72148 type:complete len:125 (+) Transcript_23457:94-468(+)